MSFLIALVALIGVLCLVLLLLTLAVVRRLREHTKLIDALYEAVGAGLAGAGHGAAAGLAVGEAAGDFDATTVDGDRVSRDLLPEGAVVAFLSPDCPGCHEQLPELVSWAADRDRSRVLAVVDGRSGDPAQLVTALSPVARVVVDDASAQVAEAFKVQAFPTFLQVGAGGRLLATAPRVSRLPAGSPA
ncbi:TlpA family protein disulfide reductase [Nonomuraea indica]|uniref:TlpA family protein disulfide reductase n=1 Tax=Nonomuraea indica TaxID=1581193 RepID=UPI0015DE0E85|nr:redoxin domain-containing protein [Nonomuraea indica]